jgi:hypothetical protein
LKPKFLRKNYEFADIFKCAEKTPSPQISNPEIMKKIGFANRKYAHLQFVTFAEIVSRKLADWWNLFANHSLLKKASP